MLFSVPKFSNSFFTGRKLFSNTNLRSLISHVNDGHGGTRRGPIKLYNWGCSVFFQHSSWTATLLGPRFDPFLPALSSASSFSNWLHRVATDWNLRECFFRFKRLLGRGCFSSCCSELNRKVSFTYPWFTDLKLSSSQQNSIREKKLNISLLYFSFFKKYKYHRH